MNVNSYVLAILAALGLVGLSYTGSEKQEIGVQGQAHNDVARVRSGFLRTEQDISLLFPHTVTEIQERTDEVLADAQRRLAMIIAVPADLRTYQNTMSEFDRLCAFSPISIFQAITELTSMVYADAEIRDAAREASRRIDAFLIDAISNNVELFKAIKTYASRSQEPLSDEQRYFITETLADFKRCGLDLPTDQRATVATLKKELADLSCAFDRNIATETRTVTVSKEGLTGLDDDFISTLKQTDDGQYILTTDYPTYFSVMMHCKLEDTRKQLYRAFSNCGYPVNEGMLKAIIAKRDAVARELGFQSYAHLNLDDQMVKHPQKAEEFLNELVARSTIKEQLEFKKLTVELPESVELTADGKLKAWDGGYLRAQYRKKHFNLDERVIAEYFPMDQTLHRLLGIYEDFLGLSFQIKSTSDLWHEDVKLIEAYDASNRQLLGYLLLDLHPRPNKYTHACHSSIVPSITLTDGTQPYVVSLMIANFPKSTVAKPALLQRSDVQIFFHEFGHALHALLGRTGTAAFSGTRVKTDFVEMPSQMLEEWLWEKDVLKRISSHYVTGESLSDELIDTIIALKHFDAGSFIQRQAFLSLVSLSYYTAGADKDVAAVMRDLFLRTCPSVAYDDESHAFASFGHLTSYGAKYYGYMWSRIFGLDLFNAIKENGLSREIGKKYVADVLSKGGSKDPMDLLVAFLGREPQQEAFFKDLTIN